MGNSLTYGGIITKVKSMSSHLAGKDDYENISHLESTADFINFLRRIPSYEQIFKDVNETTIHRGEIEELFNQSLYMDYVKIYQFATNEQRTALKIDLLRYEINILKDCLECLYNKKDEYHLFGFKEFFLSHSDLDVDGLAASQSLDEFTQKLKGTPYYNLFDKLMSSGITDLHEYQSQLDVYYFISIWKIINKGLSKKERKQLTVIYGTQIDLLNIIWTFRSKKFFNIEPKSIYLSIIPIHYKLKKEQLIQLVESNGVSEFLTILNTTHYKYLTQTPEQSSVENLYSSVIQKVYTNVCKTAPHSIANILFYLYKKENEIDRMTTALECIRYKLDPSETIKYIYSA